MTFGRYPDQKPPKSKEAPFVTAHQGLRGWFAVLIWMNPEHGGFWEPFDAHPVSHTTRAGAVADAQAWAAEAALEYKP